MNLLLSVNASILTKASNTNIAAMDLLQSELSLMGEPYSDENLIEMHSAKLFNLDCFKPLKKQFLLSDNHLRLASPPNVKKALLLQKPLYPHTPGSPTASRWRAGTD